MNFYELRTIHGYDGKTFLEVAPIATLPYNKELRPLTVHGTLDFKYVGHPLVVSDGEIIAIKISSEVFPSGGGWKQEEIFFCAENKSYCLKTKGTPYSSEYPTLKVVERHPPTLKVVEIHPPPDGTREIVLTQEQIDILGELLPLQNVRSFAEQRHFERLNKANKVLLNCSSCQTTVNPDCIVCSVCGAQLTG